MNEQLVEEIKQIFKEVLNYNQEINIHNHFIFDLGGSSLEYITLLLKLKQKYEMDFNFLEGERCYTIYEIVSYILKRGN